MLYSITRHEFTPIGIPGELVVGGDGVAKGYINNQAFTDLKFLSSPFNNDFYIKPVILLNGTLMVALALLGELMVK